MEKLKYYLNILYNKLEENYLNALWVIVLLMLFWETLARTVEGIFWANQKLYDFVNHIIFFLYTFVYLISLFTFIIWWIVHFYKNKAYNKLFLFVSVILLIFILLSS